MEHVFISYSKQNIDFARSLRRQLEAAGFPVWMDETALVPSERWWRRIEENIRSCEAFFVVMSVESESSDWVERELLLAERLRKPIFPVLLSGEPWSRLANIQYVPMTEGVRAVLPTDLTDGLARYVPPRPGEVLRVPPPLPDSPFPIGVPSVGTRRSPLRRALIPAAFALLIFVVLVFLVPQLLNPSPPDTPTPDRLTPDPAALPNLTVGRLRTSPRNPAPGQVFILSIALQNTGGAESGAFNWTWDSSLTDPVELNTLVGEVEGIPPNGSKNISFPVSYGWWGSYNTQLVVDIDSEVVESDDRDNRRPFVLTLADVPFEVDFALVPPAEVVEPPQILDESTFSEWNLRFSVAPPPGADCPDARLRIIEEAGDLLLELDGVVGACVQSRVRVDVLRDSVGAVVVELLPEEQTDSATLFLFDSLSAAEPLFSTTQIDLPGGEPTTIGDDLDTTRSIRRFEIGLTPGVVRISRIVMFRQTP
ncbi:MAG: TIR domain-containing protein [Chloroflexota bacterium]|nr:TIR domain-containing protein [Chloroflexota bacterium]